jgi:hypothetical protein
MTGSRWVVVWRRELQVGGYTRCAARRSNRLVFNKQRTRQETRCDSC